MAVPPKKKFKTRTTKAAQQAAERDQLNKMIRITAVLLVVPLVIVGVKQVNPGFFYIGQAKIMEKVGQHESAARSYEQAYEANPAQNIKWLAEAARLYEFTERYDAADQLARKVLEVDSGATPEDKGAAQVTLAWVNIANQRYDEAGALAEAGRQTAKKQYLYRAWIALGVVNTKAGNFQQADEMLDTAMAMQRLFAPEAHYYRGLMYEVWNNQKQDAIEEFDYGLSQQPHRRLKSKLMDAKARVLGTATK